MKTAEVKGETMYCESCGKQIPDDSRFCEFCGNPVKDGSNEGSYDDSVEGMVSYAAEEVNEDLNGKNKASKRRGSGYGSYGRKRARIRVLPVILTALIAAGGYWAVKSFGGDIGIPDIPGIILGKEDGGREISKDDFSWYIPASYDEVPQGGTALPYKDILGEWKGMAVNHVSEPEETFFSTAVIKENSSAGEGKTLDTAVEFTHHYVEFDGEKSEFEGDDARDLLHANFEDGYLSMALGDDRLAEVIFWEKDGKEYGQSHIYSDWDKDGIADLVNVLLFVR